MTEAEQLAALADSEIERLHHMTSGPEMAPNVPIAEPPGSPRWTNGWWHSAIQAPAHPGRIGGAIRPWSVVLHTTDMIPSSFGDLITAWTTKAGVGACAHFVIGRDHVDGVRQLVPINRNGNHAGGPGHGWFCASGQNYHPNLVSVGIEIHNAGGLRLVQGEWRWGEDRGDGKGWQPHGPSFNAVDVELDPVHPFRGWHRVTDYQYEQLELLLTELEDVLAKMPPSVIARSAPETAPAWADIKSARIVGHVDLDAANRSDPWPPVLRWLRKRK